VKKRAAAEIRMASRRMGYLVEPGGAGEIDFTFDRIARMLA
jgi:hypothetical protein